MDRKSGERERELLPYRQIPTNKYRKNNQIRKQ